MFEWNKSSLRFMQDANEYGDYAFRLASALCKHLNNYDCVCDAGCGTGTIAVELSKRVAHVDAVDISNEALNVLSERIKNEGIDNITVLCEDMNCFIAQKPYDAMVFSFFGRTDEILEIARANCSGHVLIVKRNYEGSRFSLTGEPVHRGTLKSALMQLDGLNIPYTVETHELEAGQPFCTLEDAKEFFSIYGGKESVTTDEIADRLVPVNKGSYSYYLPCVRAIGIIDINVSDINKLTGE